MNVVATLAASVAVVAALFGIGGWAVRRGRRKAMQLEEVFREVHVGHRSLMRRIAYDGRESVRFVEGHYHAGALGEVPVPAVLLGVTAEAREAFAPCCPSSPGRWSTT